MCLGHADRKLTETEVGKVFQFSSRCRLKMNRAHAIDFFGYDSDLVFDGEVGGVDRLNGIQIRSFSGVDDFMSEF